MRRAAKVDLNQRELVAVLKALGWRVVDLSKVGKGCPDLAVTRGGIWRMVEVKAAKGKLTKDQEEFHATHPVEIVRSISDCEELK